MASNVSSPPSSRIGWRLRVSLVTFIAFIAVDVSLLAACLFALRQNVKLREEVDGAYALLAPGRGTMMPPLVGQDWTGLDRGREGYRLRGGSARNASLHIFKELSRLQGELAFHAIVAGLCSR